MRIIKCLFLIGAVLPQILPIFSAEATENLSATKRQTLLSFQSCLNEEQKVFQSYQVRFPGAESIRGIIQKLEKTQQYLNQNFSQESIRDCPHFADQVLALKAELPDAVEKNFAAAVDFFSLTWDCSLYLNAWLFEEEEQANYHPDALLPHVPPNENQILIHTKGSFARGWVKASLRSIIGKTLIQAIIPGNEALEIPLRSYSETPAGIYYLTLENETGTITRKIIRE